MTHLLKGAAATLNTLIFDQSLLLFILPLITNDLLTFSIFRSPTLNFFSFFYLVIKLVVVVVRASLNACQTVYSISTLFKTVGLSERLRFKRDQGSFLPPFERSAQ